MISILETFTGVFLHNKAHVTSLVKETRLLFLHDKRIDLISINHTCMLDNC